MGGIFGKNKRLCVFPKRVVFYKAKGKKTSGTVRMFCDASTWTGENHFHSARIGRTPKDSELSVVELALDTPESDSAAQAKWKTEDQAATLHAHPEGHLPVTAGDSQDVEASQDPETKPSIEVMQHQELAEQTKQEAQSAGRISQKSRKTEAVLHPAGSCIPNKQLSYEDHQAIPLTQTTVKAEVHVSADVDSGPDKVQSATVEPELLAGAEQEAAVVCASQETCIGKAHEEVPVQKAVDSPAASCAEEESELPLKTTETREGITNVQRSAEEQAVEEKACCAAKAPGDLQLEQDTEATISEDQEENPFPPEQAKEMAEACDMQTSKELPCCLAETQVALQDREKINASRAGKPEEH